MFKKRIVMLALISLGTSCSNINPTVTSTATPGTPPLKKRVFVTSGLYRVVTDFIGLSGADAACQAAATGAGLGGTWKAWLSTSASPANSRISDVSPWYKIDRTTLMFAGYPSGLTFNLSAFNTDQNGATVSNNNVWTQSFADGGVAVPIGYDCAGWTSATPGFYGNVGAANQIGNGWTVWGNLGCDSSVGAHFYCFEQ